VDMGTFRGLFTLVMILLFVGLVLWAYSGKRKKTLDAAAQLPLEEHGGKPPAQGRQTR
jgi:cytochrome c oxidase cbb3-type subunit 4